MKNKIKVATLTGAQLDYWVAKAQNICVHKNTEDWTETDPIYEYETYTRCLDCKREEVGHELKYSPSTDWSQGGPIIKINNISLLYEDYANKWSAHESKESYQQNGRDVVTMIITYDADPLIAAMRCFIASKFGEEVDEI